MSDYAIHARNISKFYKLYDSPRDRLREALNPFGKKYHRKYYALKNIDLDVEHGEILGIVGKNGCGKSTLLKVISGVLTADSGALNVRGKISALLELGSGFNPEFTGIQNIYFYGSILGLTREEIDSMLDEILSFADIGEYVYQPLKTYSSGMKARLSFSVATAVQPKILILDEVLSVGDAAFRRKSSTRMQSLIESGCAVLLVSHNEDSINRLCTSAIYLRNGEIVFSGMPKTVTKIHLKISDSDKSYSSKEIRNIANSLHNNTPERNGADTSSISSDEDGSFYSEVIKQLSQPVITRNFPIELYSADIYSRNNNKVNVLEYGSDYKLVLRYFFNSEKDNVVFPMAISTQEGQFLSGIRNPDDGSMLSVKPNTLFESTYEFKCTLLQGMYYITAGVRHLIGKEKYWLYRADDVLCFKVQDHSNKEHWGLFSLEVYKMERNIMESE